jgi:hypothetical protein
MVFAQPLAHQTRRVIAGAGFGHRLAEPENSTAAAIFSGTYVYICQLLTKYILNI